MIYQAQEMYTKTKAFMNSIILMNQEIINHPHNPLKGTLVGDSIKASLASADRQTKCYNKLPFGIESVIINGEETSIEESIVCQASFCNLLHFKADTIHARPKLLVVAPLSGHHATLLRDTVTTLLCDNDVYVTDWLDARDIPLSEGVFGFDCYVEYLIEFMEFLGEDVHMLAVCQPTVQALIATAVMSEKDNPCTPKSLTLIAGPIDTSINPSKVNDYASGKDISYFKDNVISTVPSNYLGKGRKVYAGFLQLSSFIAMNPTDHIDKYKTYFNDVFQGRESEAEQHEKFYDEYMSVLDLSADFFLETLERVFLDQQLTKGIMTYKGDVVDLGCIKNTPIYTIEGENDDICSLGQTEAAHDLCTNLSENDKKWRTFPVGHYGSFSGSVFRNKIAPSINDFIFNNSRLS